MTRTDPRAGPDRRSGAVRARGGGRRPRGAHGARAGGQATDRRAADPGPARHLTPADRRAEEYNWRTVELLLEGGVFLVLGLQLHGLVDEVREVHGSLWTALRLGALTWLGLLAIRTLFFTALLSGLRRERARLPAVRARLEAAQEILDTGQRSVPPTEPTTRTRSRIRWWRWWQRAQPGAGESRAARRNRIQRFIDQRLADIDYLANQALGPREGALLVWAGLRGAVTLAAAQSLPADTPQRALLILVAFVVAAGSLLVQGGTLPLLVRRLRLDGGDPAAALHERRQLVEQLARVAAAECDRPDLTRPDGTRYDPAVVRVVREESVRLVDSDGFDLIPGTDTTRFGQHRDLRLAVLRAKRDALLRERSIGAYSADSLSTVLEMLDADEIGLRLRGHLTG